MDVCAENKNRLFRTVRDIEKARKFLDLPDGAVKYLEYAVQRVSPTDCTDGGKPAWYGRVDDMAYDLRVKPRTVWNYEKALEKAGLIERNAMGNGHRRAYWDNVTGERKVHGVSLAPLIELRDQIAEMVVAIDAEDRRFRAARESVLQARARLIDAIRATEDSPALFELRNQGQAVFDANPDRIVREFHSADELARITALLTSAHEALEAGMVQIVEPDDNSIDDEDISDASENDFRHKYDTTPISLYNCSQQTPPKNGGGSHSSKTRSDEREWHRHKNVRGPIARNPKCLFEPDNFELGRVARVLPEDWLSLLGPCPLSWEVLPDLAEVMSARLGVGNHGWLKARQQIGPIAAAAALLILDKNRDHPKHPVSNVGGALNGMLRKAEIEELDLPASLHGVLDRCDA